ncbi:DUF6942 family protein [Enterovibrio coralii]|uniref:Uncharacterized protein n=1 Tax=Enterovibrio coralii TaxID=294935 RepID=A0A135I8G6_9GAMM|nr:hypothetical protein [Enterovibrio coralii]KXF81740.1 hypothetical protein ATN88_03595 [Enterovibrio coralii]
MNTFSIGNPNATFNVYVEKPAPLAELTGVEPDFGSVTPLKNGDIKALGDLGGNGWRKVFNVYAKLLFALDSTSRWFPSGYTSWQAFRDEALLQTHSDFAIHFSNIAIDQTDKQGTIHIIAGRTHAMHSGIAEQCVWMNQEFARHPTKPILVCPYFDYRQLSNVKIEYLVNLISSIENC